MFFPDLSPYSYALPRSLPDVLNVGWLAKGQAFRTGSVPALFEECLKGWMAIAKANQMRGIHQCDFCPIAEPPTTILQPPIVADINGNRMWLGSAEIWIPAPNGKIFASPTLILRYVQAHGYQPPDEFVFAAMRQDLMEGWDAVAESEKRIEAVFL